ncbi:MAG: hypothetical protein K6253_00645 [Candidatus Liberibacter asiaticus]|nr:hypothetical protein [Candidatus Liberibacter asiaticus]
MSLDYKLKHEKFCSSYFQFCYFFFSFTFNRIFVGIITENIHETTTLLLGQPRGLKACCIC